MNEQERYLQEVARPLVENLCGPLPEFKLRNDNGWYSRYETGMDFQKGELFIRIPPVKHNDYLSRLHPVTHELFHLYQFEPLREKIGFLRNLPDITYSWVLRYRFNELLNPLSRFIDPNKLGFLDGGIFNQWIEGSAELATAKIMYEQAYFDHELQDDVMKYSRQVRGRLLLLKGKGIIDNPSLEIFKPALNASPEAVGEMDKEIKKYPMFPRDIRNSPKPDCYMTGWIYCARYIKETGMGIKELLQTPLTNRELKRKKLP